MLARIGVAVVAGLVLLGRPAAANPWIGSVDMNAACQEQYNDPTAWASWYCCSYTAYDWLCFDASGDVTYGGIDVNAYCHATYGKCTWANPQGGGLDDWACYSLPGYPDDC